MVVAIEVVLDDSTLPLILVRMVIDVDGHGAHLLRSRLVSELLEQHLRRSGESCSRTPCRI